MPPARLRPLVRTAALAALVTSVAACSDSPMGPSPADGPDLQRRSIVAAPLTTVTGLLYLTPVTQLSASKTIGSAGGTLTVGGLTMTVPRGAVTSNVTFRVTRLPGSMVAYDFQPHGMKFAQPIRLQFAASNTGLSKLSTLSDVQGAHFVDAASLNQLLGLARVSEFAPATVARDRSTVTFSVGHFSGWMVSTGRSDASFE